MVYINTKDGWFSTGEDDINQTPIFWIRYAVTYYDSKINSFIFPGSMRNHKAQGFPELDPVVKVKMWTLQDKFPLFSEHIAHDIHTN
jgi:IS1 family transposase